MTTWHADDALLSEYVDGTTDYVLSASVETHLMGCAMCRSKVGATVDSRRLETLLAGAIDRIDAPRSGVVERGICRLGVRPDTARLLVATPLMRASWLAAVVAVLAFAALAARADPRGVIVFLTLAPLAPVVGVATAFGMRSDPSEDVGVAAPYSSLRLLLLRAVAVLVTSAVGAACARLLLPDVGGEAWAWLLPALALTGVTLAASQWVDLTMAAAVITGAWVLSVFALRADDLPVFGRTGQLVFLIIGLASAAELHRHRDRFNPRGSAS
jgi:hypothetical protein